MRIETRVGLFIIVVISLQALSDGVDSMLEKTEAEIMAEEKITACVEIESHVKSKLVSPGSAKFPLLHHQLVEYLGDNRYSLGSYVDSQNGFGASLRTNFYCTIKKVGSEWEIETCEMR